MTTSYTPADLGASVLAGAGAVVPWLAAVVAAAIGIMFTFIGIRKAVAWGAAVADERDPGASLSLRDSWNLGAAMSDPVNQSLGGRWEADYADGIAAGWGEARARAYADKEEANLEEGRLRRSGSS